MNVGEIEHILESWAPRWLAWERDNVGLQIGDRSRQAASILVALDPTEAVAEEAVRKKIDLVITHHPLFFRPPQSITTAEPAGRITLKFAQHSISLIAAHTNLDFTEHGVSIALAEDLGLRDIRFLAPLKDQMAKLVVFVPPSHAEDVARALSAEGAGVIGKYTECTFRTQGTGTFKGSEESNPFIGKPGAAEQTEEVRLETMLPRALVHRAVAAMKKVHPYEEPAYDLYTLSNPHPNAGMGAIGSLPAPVTERAFLLSLKRRLKLASVRYAPGTGRRIQSVAVCGGSGADLLDEAVRAGADAFVTADVRYHAFHQASGRILLADAGHGETEQVIVPRIARRLRTECEALGASLTIQTAKTKTNPLLYL